MQAHRWIKAALALSLALGAATGSLRAQGGTEGQTPPIVGGLPLFEAWVDPYNGNNALGAVETGAVRSGDRPFLTLNAAIAAVAAVAGPVNRGVVHANPGVYSLATNGEVLPITMREYVHVQGVDARSTLIRGDGVPDGLVPQLPVDQGGCTCGARVASEILVDFSFTVIPDVIEMFDGFTLQGGNIQLYAEAEVHPVQGRVSNCVFDMLNFSDVGLAGPAFGILMAHTWELDVGGYFDVQLHVFNNTFVHTWVPTPGVVFQSLPNSVAICDVNDPLCGNPDGDPNPTLRGVGNPNIQNNLIRQSTTNGAGPRTPMLGIDASDVTVAIGTVLGPTNAFDAALAGGFDITATYCSLPIGATPPAVINPDGGTGGTDPGFVGEYLSGALGIPFTTARDWRLLSTSGMVGLGSAPIGGLLVATNGTTHLVPPLIPEMSFDFDGEVYGNLRLQGAVDLGFDETDIVITCGGYANDSRNIFGPLFAGDPTGPGNGFSLHIFPPAGGSYIQVDAVTPVTPTGYSGPFANPAGYFWAYSHPFGALAPAPLLPVPGPPPVTNTFQWLNLAPPPVITLTARPAVPVPAGTPYVAAADPLAVTTHLVGFVVDGFTTGAGNYLTQQMYFVPTGGGIAFLSNLQASRD